MQRMALVQPTRTMAATPTQKPTAPIKPVTDMSSAEIYALIVRKAGGDEPAKIADYVLTDFGAKLHRAYTTALNEGR